MIVRLLPVSRDRRLSSPAAATAAVAVALLFLLSAALPVLSAPAPQAEPFQHQVAVSVKLVQVYVTAKDGVPVPDLTAADFEVFDNNRRYPVTHFERHFLEDADAAPAATAAAPAGPTAAAPLGRKFFLVFDFAFMDPKAVLRARSAALEFLEAELQPTDEIGVLSYQTGRGLVLHEYLTADHARVRSIVEGFGASPRAGRAADLTQFIFSSETAVAPAPGSRAAEAAAPDPESQFYDGMARAQAGIGASEAGRESYVDQARRLATALGQMARVLRTVPGFKNIILFSGGVARQYLYGSRGGAVLGEWTSPEELAAQLREYDSAQASSSLRDDHSAMIREFKAANCPVYTVDVSRRVMTSDVQTQAGVSGAGLREFEGADSLRQVASGTGGRFYAKTMDESRIAEDIRKSTSAYYVLGYAVEEAYDGRFHKIRVEVKRKGVDVTAQGGYFSAKPFKDFTRFEKLMHIVEAALGETPETQVPLGIPVAALPLTLKGWPQALVFARAPLAILAGVLGDKAEAYLLLTDEKGDIASIKRYALPALPPGKEIFFPSFLLPAKPGRYDGRIVLRNLETGRTARGSAALVVPAERVAVLGLDPPLLLGPETEAADLAPEESAVAGLFGYDPAAYAPRFGEVPAGTVRLHAALRVQGGAAAKELTVAAAVIDLATSARAAVPATVVGQSDDGPTRLLLIELTAGGLEPGRYALECAVKEPATGESAVASSGFTVK